MNPLDLHAMPDEVTRALPHAVGPEKSVLSSILQDPPEYLARAAELNLTPEQFYLPAHRTLLEVFLKISEKAGTIELVSLTQHLLDNGKLDRVGGPSALADIQTYSPTSAHFERHVKAIQDKHTLREIIRVANESIGNAYDAPGEAQEALDTAERDILAIRESVTSERKGGIGAAIDSVLDDISAICSGKKDEIGLLTGFPRLDQLTGGLKPAEMFVIAARPSMGKTALMMNIVEHCVFSIEKPALVFSCEMSEKQIVSRLMFSRAKFNPALLNGEKPTKGDLMRIQRAAIEIKQAHLHIDDTPAITITALRAKARRMKSRHNIALIAVDYLQLLRSTSRQADNSREREIGEISAGLKAMAKELNIPVIVLAQLNRESEKRSGKSKGVPRMSDLRESGTIEQDADMVGLLYRDAYFADGDEAKEESAGTSRLIMAKNRSGATGDVHLVFIPELVRFETGFPPAEKKTEPNAQSRFK